MTFYEKKYFETIFFMHFNEIERSKVPKLGTSSGRTSSNISRGRKLVSD
jgi:hypothetical protein